ncbi:unnamed protein product [Schistosoma turkestanicum]|nr:unnamed protein product [Schistosoma turkestanicum]
MTMKQPVKSGSKLFLAKIKENRKKTFRMVEKLAKQPVLFKQLTKEFSNTATDLISSMKSTSDHTIYLNSIVETELIVFLLNVMLKSSGARHMLVQNELFSLLKKLHQSLNSISPPFNGTTLRELSIQDRIRDQHNSSEQDPSPAQISNNNNYIKASVTDRNEENCQILVNNIDNNVTITSVSKSDCSTFAAEKSKRKSLKRSRKFSNNDEEFLICK